MRVVRALALIVVGVLIVIEPDAFIHLLALAVGLYVAYAGVSELMRITIAPATEEQREAGADPRPPRPGRPGIAAAVIIIGGAIFIASGGTVSESLRMRSRPRAATGTPNSAIARSTRSRSHRRTTRCRR